MCSPGTSWPNPSHITYSIAPDGVFWDHGTNNLNATFNAKFGTSGIWERQIALALATWESVANINIVPVADGPYDYNTLGLAQGDPRFGDIRIGGYAFPDTTITLAQTYFPPPNGSTAAGDVELNTAMNYNIGSTYDLYSVVLHETGHSLGLNEAPNPAEVMATDYGGIRTGLQPGDIAGIQAIYGARTLDGYQSQGIGVGLGDPIDLTKQSGGVQSGGDFRGLARQHRRHRILFFRGAQLCLGNSPGDGGRQQHQHAQSPGQHLQRLRDPPGPGEQSLRLERQRDGEHSSRRARPALLHGRDGRHRDLLRRGCLPARRLTAAELAPELASANSTPRGADRQLLQLRQPPPVSRASSGDEYQSTNGDPSGSGHADDPCQSELQLGIHSRVFRFSEWLRREPTSSTLRELRSRCSTLEEG